MKHEHRAPSHVDRRQRAIELIELPPGVERVGWRGGHRLALLRGAAVGVDGVASTVPSRVRRHADRDLKQPRPRTVPAIFEVVEAAVRDDEDLLRLVVDLGLVHPEAAEVAPHEVELGFVHRTKRDRARAASRVAPDTGAMDPMGAT